MKREFLKNLGLSEEAIDKIMAENGNDINDLKTQIQATTTERDGFKDQLKQRDTDITELKKSAATADELKTKFAELETKYQKDTGDLSTKMAQQAFDAKLDLSLTGKVKNPKAARALLDIEKIKLKDGELDGLEPQLTALKTSDPYLFNEEPGKLAGKTPLAGGAGAGATPSLHDAIAQKVQSQFSK
jgi:chromosome segregation ATPase